MIDFILSNTADEHVKKSINYVLLQKVIDKKLQNQKYSSANRLTSFRQKNELNRALVKRITCELEDFQPSKKDLSLKELCSTILETLRMTVNETIMDITKSQDNYKKVVEKLNRIYFLTEQATNEMKKVTKNKQFQ